MKRTKTLRLQKPEAGDEYNSSVLTSNTSLINKMMANIGGNVAKRTVPLSNVFTMREGFALDGGSFTVYGNGLAWIELNFSTTKSFNVTDITGLITSATVADVNPEFATIIAAPLTSGGRGPAVNGYIAPNTTRVVLRLMNGYFPSGIQSGQILQLSGFYPLVEVPTSIGLEQMRSEIFDYEVHNTNLMKIDAVAERLKTNLGSTNAANSSLTPVGDVTIESRILHLNTNGLVTFSCTFRKATYIPGSTGGDIGNTPVLELYPSWRPDRFVKLISNATGPLLHGEVNPNTGIISITSNVGRGVLVPSNTSIQLAGDWPYNGN